MGTLASMQEYHCLLTAEKIILAFGGEIKDGVVTSVMGIVDKYLQEESNISLKRRVLQVLVECVQNIERHGNNKGLNKASILLMKQNMDYLISVRNQINDSVISGLKEKIEKVNSLSKTELVDYYKKALRENTLSDKGGAGLGLIEISRKSGNKINYDFDTCEEGKPCFSMMVTVSNQI